MLQNFSHRNLQQFYFIFYDFDCGYSDNGVNDAEKSFMVLVTNYAGTGAYVMKLFTAVIYEFS
jgi:hypothetical protein